MSDPNPSSLVANGVIVSDASSLPCNASVVVASAPDVAINPRAFVANGDIVSDSNPLPITMV